MYCNSDACSRRRSPAVPPNPATPSYSNTTIGQLIENVNGGGAFGSAEVFYFDGAGNISVVPSPPPAVGLFVNVGTYSVNSDCTISIGADQSV